MIFYSYVIFMIDTWKGLRDNASTLSTTSATKICHRSIRHKMTVRNMAVNGQKASLGEPEIIQLQITFITYSQITFKIVHK